MSNGIFLMYDITKESTFESIKYWLESIQGTANNPVLFLIGNKLDKKSKRVIYFISTLSSLLNSSFIPLLISNF